VRVHRHATQLEPQRLAVDARSLASATARHPMNTVHVLARIYGQALRLKLRGVPVYPHPAKGTR